MAGTGRLSADPLFQGLTRPPMIIGVSYLYFVTIALFCLLTFVWTGNFIVLFFLAPILWGIGYLLCRNEPRAIELLLLRGKWGFRCRNRMFHGNTNSYDMF